MRIVLDFETANIGEADLLKEGGVQAYAAHPATEVLCLCFLSTPLGLKSTWSPLMDEYSDLFELEALVNWALKAGHHFEAHNAAFEQMIWKHIMERRYGMPPIPISRWHDSMAKAYQAGLPGSLDDGAKMLQLSELKDKAASKMTIALSKSMTDVAWKARMPEDWEGTWDGKNNPWKALKPAFDRSPETIRAVIDYCHSDCRVEELLSDALPDLSAEERRVWELDQIINWRGVAIDRALCQQVNFLVHNALAKGTRHFLELTGGVLVGSPALIPWVESQGVEVPTKICPSGKKKGQRVKTLDKAAIDKLLGGKLEDLEADEEEEDDLQVDGDAALLPEHVREVLQAKRLLGASAVKKLPKMLAAIQDSPDDRARYSIQYYGSHTGRWAGRGFQPHNFPREGLKTPYFDEKKGKWAERSCDPAEAVEWFYKGALFVEARFQEDVLLAAGKVLRHSMTAGPGNTFLVGDYAGVEMRVDLALAGQHDKCEMLRQSDTGEKPVDIYLDCAEGIYNIPKGQWNVPDKAILARMKDEHLAERTIGKNTVLGCGFQMGPDTFHERYCKDQPPEFAERIVKSYRTDFAPEVVKLWYGLGDCAVAALLSSGPMMREYARSRGAEEWQLEKAVAKGCSYRGVTFALEGDWLTILMPSGRKLFYYRPFPALKFFDNGGSKLGLTYQAYVKGMSRPEQHTYGGKLCENVVQALARDLLVHSMFRLEENGFPVVLTVHDEIVCEVPAATADVKAFKQIMEVRPRWAVDMGVPIAIEEWVGDRYRK